MEDVCDEVVTDHFAPIVVRQGARYIYCVPYPIEISVFYPGASERGVMKPRKTLEDVGILRWRQDVTLPRRTSLILSMEQHQASRIYEKGSATGDYEARPPWVSCADILDPHHRSVWDSNGWSWSFKVLNISFVVQSTTELGLRRVWRRPGTRRY